MSSSSCERSDDTASCIKQGTMPPHLPDGKPVPAESVPADSGDEAIAGAGVGAGGHGTGGNEDDDDDADEAAEFVDCYQRPASLAIRGHDRSTSKDHQWKSVQSTQYPSESSAAAVTVPMPLANYPGASIPAQPDEFTQQPFQVPKPFVPYDSPMLQTQLLGNGFYNYEQASPIDRENRPRDSYAPSENSPENIIDSYGNLDMPADPTSDSLLDEEFSLYGGDKSDGQHIEVKEQHGGPQEGNDAVDGGGGSPDFATLQPPLSPSLEKIKAANSSAHSLNNPPTYYDLPPTIHLTTPHNDDFSAPHETEETEESEKSGESRESAALELYDPALFTPELFDKCREPWSLSTLASWLCDTLGNRSNVKKQNVVDALTHLFTHKIPALRVSEAEKISSQAVDTFAVGGVIVMEDEDVRMQQTASVSGVLPQFTGGGCYSSAAHDDDDDQGASAGGSGSECYSPRCTRSVRRSRRRETPSAEGPTWQDHYGLTKEQLDNIDGKEKQRQSVYYEIIELCDKAAKQSRVWLSVWRDALLEKNAIKPQSTLDSFVNDVFGDVEGFIAALETSFVPELKKRQEEQGPFLAGLGDLFVEWLPTAENAFAACARANARAIHLILRELSHNQTFADVFKEADENPVCERLGWRHFLGIPLRISQRYPLLLSTVLKKCPKDTAESENLTRALEEAKSLTSKCDELQGFHELEYKFLWGTFRQVPFAQLGKRVIYQGVVQRSSHKFSLTDVSLLLMDNYLIVYKEKDSFYHINRPPIPIDLLVLESINDEPLMKSAVMGIVSAGVPATRFNMGMIQSSTVNDVQSPASPPSVTKASTASVDTPSSKEDRFLYPFKFKCLGRNEVHALLATSLSQWQTICRSILGAQATHGERLKNENSEPYRLNVLSDSAFSSPDFFQTQSTNLVVPGSPLDVAITAFEEQQPRQTPLCRAKLNCATVFTAPATGIVHCVVGTDNGAFITQYPSPIAWQRTVFSSQKITHIAILEDYSIISVLADRTVFTCDLNVFADPHAQEPHKRNGPQKLSNGRDVDYLTAGRTKDGLVLMYKKKKSGQSVFKMWEPLREEMQTSWSLFHRTRKEKFRFIHAFYIPSPEIVSVNIYNSIIAISADDDIELLNIETKETLRPIESTDGNPEVQAIYERLRQQQPLCMLRYDEGNFFLAKDDSGVMVDRSRRINPNFHYHWYTKPHHVCINGSYLVLVNDDFIEILSAADGRRRQIIPGKHISLLDDGGNISRAMANFNRDQWAKTQQPPRYTGFGVPGTVKFAMQHPRRPQDQVILELVEN